VGEGQIQGAQALRSEAYVNAAATASRSATPKVALSHGQNTWLRPKARFKARKSHRARRTTVPRSDHEPQRNAEGRPLAQPKHLAAPQGQIQGAQVAPSEAYYCTPQRPRAAAQRRRWPSRAAKTPGCAPRPDSRRASRTERGVLLYAAATVRRSATPKVALRRSQVRGCRWPSPARLSPHPPAIRRWWDAAGRSAPGPPTSLPSGWPALPRR